MLKIEPFSRFLRLNTPCVSYVGLRADEEDRLGGSYDHVPGVIQRYPIREWGFTLEDVLGYLNAKKIVIPVRTDCDRCFFQTLWEWYLLWRDKPEKYSHAERQEATVGHTFRSPQRDTQPTSLKDLRAKFESGYVPTERRRDSLKAMQCRVCSM